MKLNVRNFGPIRGGFGDFIEFAKVTLFCGPQGSGKSTIAKLLSSLVAQAEAVARKAGMKESVVRQLPIPAESLVAATDIRLYEMHLDGTITLSQGSDGFISDANPLNRTLAEFNEAYAQLFEIEDANV